MHRLQLHYRDTVVPAMRARFGYRNDLAVPRVIKVVLNVGVGRIAKDKALLDNVVAGLTAISGQKPVPTAAKKSIASFKSRKGMLVGYRVTLRGKRRLDFMDRLISVALPRTHDFRGLGESSVDGRGNLTIGIREHIVFPEISTEQARNIWGFEATVVTNARSHAEGLALLQLFGFPIRAEE
ncbi:50S ribosomal protein L5 [Candidatus Parcubacteria bacterium]|nr:50S ribosomal protein L5 [Candidatus Parcubacteria bacterium]MBI4098971.1 50S ribosomal protein L5 [Candidatus Parcubacteria bacterium]MBI4385332.1 50S ribosomal protein L5 [Candidatus Parcubacteria bacterium]